MAALVHFAANFFIVLFLLAGAVVANVGIYFTLHWVLYDALRKLTSDLKLIRRAIWALTVVVVVVVAMIALRLP